MAVNSLMGSSVGLGVNSRGLRSGPGVGWGFLGGEEGLLSTVYLRDQCVCGDLTQLAAQHHAAVGSPFLP